MIAGRTHVIDVQITANDRRPVPFHAKLTALRTRPYGPEDLAQMEEELRQRFASGYYEKVLSEDFIDEFESDSLENLGESVRQIAEANEARPIIVTATKADELPMKHSFLIKRSYVPDDEKRLFELIVYEPKDPMVWKVKLEESARKKESRKLSQSEQQEFTQKALRHMFEETEKTLAYVTGRSTDGPGFSGGDELRAIYTDLQSKKGDFATDKEFMDYFVSEFGKRTDAARARRREELIRKPPFYASRMSSILNDEMTVICRIVGRDKELVYKHLEYYKSFHSKTDYVYSIDNDADDGLHVSFVYGKDFDE